MSEMRPLDVPRLQSPGPPEIEVAANTRTLVVGPYLTRNTAAVDLAVVQAISLNLPKIRPSTYLGKGRVEEIAGLIKAEEIGLVVMDCALSTRRRVPPSCRTARQ